MTTFARGALLLALALSPVAHAGGDAEAGRIKANTCMGCHGIPNYSNAYPNYRVPKLGGQSEGLIVAALQEYKAGNRPHKTMHGQAASLSDQDIADIAAFLTKAAVHKDDKPGRGTNSDFEKAKTCFACHGQNGSKPLTPEYPILAGQYESYLEHALNEYHQGLRKNPIMGAQAAALSAADIKELATYFSRQLTPLYTPSVEKP